MLIKNKFPQYMSFIMFSLTPTLYVVADSHVSQTKEAVAQTPIQKQFNQLVTHLKKEQAKHHKLTKKVEAKAKDKITDEDRSLALKSTQKAAQIDQMLYYIEGALLSQINKKDYESAKSALLGYNSRYKNAPDGSIVIIQTLIQTIDKEEAKEAEKNRSELVAFNKQIAESILSAKKISDLDDELVSIARLKEKLSGARNKNYKLTQQLDQTKNIVSSWQDYLCSLEEQNYSGAKNHLSTINRTLVNHPIIPRSKILKLQSKLSNPKQNVKSEELSIENIVEKFTKADQLSQVIEACEKLENSKSSSTRTSAKQLKDDANLFLKCRNLIALGDNAKAMILLQSTSTSYNQRNWRDTIKQEINLAAFTLMIPQEYRDSTKEKQPIQQIEYVAKKLKEKESWFELWEFLNLSKGVVTVRSNSINSQFYAWFDNDIKALQYHLAGIRYEAAGELSKALTNYRSALSKTGKFSPYDAAQKAIKNIRENKAEALAKNEQAEIITSQTTLNGILNSRNIRSRTDNNEQVLRKEVAKLVAQHMALHIKSMQKKTPTEQQTKPTTPEREKATPAKPAKKK